MGESIRTLLKKSSDTTVHNFKDSEMEFTLPSVVLDFSSPDCLFGILKTCIDKKLPLIIGTTGLNSDHHALIKKAQHIIPILVASNMSVGIAKLKQSIEHFLQTSTGPFECSITEIHHSNKIDSPSGTALEIRGFLENFLADKIISSIAVKSLRLGKIFGIHRVEFYDNKETIFFQHIADSRDVFASGAINAAHWIISCPPGIYNFNDFLSKKL